MLTFTVATDRRKWLVIRVPSGSVAIYETTEKRYRYIPVAVSDMSDAISYISDRLRDCSEKRFSAIYRGVCFAYAGCDEHRFVFLPQKFVKVADFREALECCVDYLTEKGEKAHAVD